ncbi:hypothetical protein [Anaerolentibacter hominis]|uniref:hypothetical protein n=1 Tax=Anaerolentibacter hominis TaxID=3079009 RepID=UPI0031B827F0
MADQFSGSYSDGSFIGRHDLPIGFTMELAQNQEALLRFSKLDKGQQKAVADGARNVRSREEMRVYVNHIR